MKKENATESALSFYDAIATRYDELMTDDDRLAREQIAQLFTHRVTEGPILDFGGGTGLDLHWLAEKYPSVFFLEPSPNMRAEAKEKSKNFTGVQFIENRTDFAQWSSNTIPVHERMNGIIANFAALNCIENIALFFEKIALFVTKGSTLLVTVIDPRPARFTRNYSALLALRLFVSTRITIIQAHDGKRHTTYVHSLKALRRAAKKYFVLDDIITIEHSGFASLIFTAR